MSKEGILLVGGGGHCKSVIDVVEEHGVFDIAGIIDVPNMLGKEVLGYSVIGNDDDLHELFERYKYAFITVGQIGSSEVRRKLFRILKNIGFILPSIASPRAYVSKHALLGEGSVIMHDAFVNASTTIGNNCIVNTKAIIEHDVFVGDNCHISTGSIINGGVVVSEGSFVGSNSTTKESISIKENSFIKAGSVVK